MCSLDSADSCSSLASNEWDACRGTFLLSQTLHLVRSFESEANNIGED